ncbi:hypothetical protein [Algoriphagus lacus]|uniref:hypothetical protein n=1 Tax=Algoriphagus lacus TaxID=2056311 RepID=UPI001F1A3B1E|nr:hypothetical protein [Algoriphagus lacus]
MAPYSVQGTPVQNGEDAAQDDLLYSNGYTEESSRNSTGSISLSGSYTRTIQTDLVTFNWENTPVFGGYFESYIKETGRVTGINYYGGAPNLLGAGGFGDMGGAGAQSGGGGHSFADNVGLAGTIGDPIGSGAKGILDNRGAYMPRGQIYGMNREITVRTPIANINTTSKVLNYARVGGKVLGVAGVVATGYQMYGDIDGGRYYSAGTRAAVFGVGAGAAFIPVVGWGVAAGIGVADYIWGDQFYNYVENRMR